MTTYDPCGETADEALHEELLTNVFGPWPNSEDLEDDVPEDPELAFFMKYIADGCDSIPEVIRCLEGVAADLEVKEEEGWTLTQTVENGWLHFSRPKVEDDPSGS